MCYVWDFVWSYALVVNDSVRVCWWLWWECVNGSEDKENGRDIYKINEKIIIKNNII